MKKIFAIITGLISFLAISNIALAYTGDIAIDQKDITFSTNDFTEGKTIRIYATASNQSNQDLLGIIRFFDNDNQIGSDQVISVFARKNDGVFIDWTPGFGTHTVKVKIFPWLSKIDDPGDNVTSTKVTVLQDTDHDGIPNSSDPDMDSDGVENIKDAFPINPKEWKDSDGDGIGDNSDPDIDNDGVPNKFDEMPLDANETLDTDKDSIGNIADTDDDNDTLPDSQEEKTGTNPLKVDTDGDGINDNQDDFPLDQKESKDTDKDNIGDNSDTDKDNDGISNNDDPFPLNVAPIIELDINDSKIDLSNTIPEIGSVNITNPTVLQKTSTPLNPNINTSNTAESEIVNIFTPQVFNATHSFDKDGKVVSFTWKIDGKETKEGNSITETFNTLGKHNVKLTITDDSGQSVSKNFEVSVMNLSLYKELGLALAVILLALMIYFKYITGAKDRKDQNTEDKKFNL